MKRQMFQILTIVAVTGALGVLCAVWFGARHLSPYFDPTARATPVTPEPTTTQGESLDTLLEPIRERFRRPALAAAVIRGGEVSALGAVGVRKAGAPERVTHEDRFHIGSCTKAMTATLIATLVEDGKMHWQSTVGETFPDLREGIHPRFRAVTIEQLLHHRSGLPEDRRPDRKIFPQLRRLEGPMLAQRRRLVQLALARKPAAEPGSVMQYSNYGYAVAGTMAEQITGKPWEDLLRARLFAPLGMTTAGFGAPGETGAIDQPRGHRRNLGAFLPVEPGPRADNPPVLGPAGTVHCSIGDFARWAAFHLRGARGEGTLLRPETFAKLHDDAHGQGYAMGWGVVDREWADGTALTHAGSNTMFMAVVWIAPRLNLALVAATNSGDPKAFPACDATIGALLESLDER